MKLLNTLRKKYAEYGQSLPSETAQRLSAVEILGESLVSEMDEKDRELSRATSVRAEFASDLEEVTSWLGKAEARVLDRGAEPHALKDGLAEVSCEIGDATEQIERLSKNGQSLAERWVFGEYQS